MEVKLSPRAETSPCRPRLAPADGGQRPSNTYSSAAGHTPPRKKKKKNVLLIFHNNNTGYNSHPDFNLLGMDGSGADIHVGHPA